MDRRVAVEIAQEKTDKPRGDYPPKKDPQNGPTEDLKREEATDLTENQEIIKEKAGSVKRIRKTTAGNNYNYCELCDSSVTSV